MCRKALTSVTIPLAVALIGIIHIQGDTISHCLRCKAPYQNAIDSKFQIEGRPTGQFIKDSKDTVASGHRVVVVQQ